jgi:hypothetical protein
MERKETPRVDVCSDCDDVSRRGFLRSVGAVAAAGIAVPGASGLLATESLLEEKKKKKPAETFVKRLYESLSAEQKKGICMPFDHKLRSTVKNNWHIVPKKQFAIGTFFNGEQQELIREILKGVTSEDGYERFTKAMKDDDGGLGNYVCAIFGEPGQDKFEWVLTGRHLTIRADGDSVKNAALGGPVFYGHAVEGNEKPDHPGNVWWHQARLANKVYKALDGKQQEKALVVTSPKDRASSIQLGGKRKSDEPEGLLAADMSADQKKLLESTLKSLLSMYRKSDVDEAMGYIKKTGGIDALRVSFFEEGDIGDDEIWDRWKVEGPAIAWYFRGSPHVHTWVNIAHATQGAKKETTAARKRV